MKRLPCSILLFILIVVISLSLSGCVGMNTESNMTNDGVSAQDPNDTSKNISNNAKNTVDEVDKKEIPNETHVSGNPLSYGKIIHEKECDSDSDCVPERCCHPKKCVSLDKKPNCEGIMCTMDYQEDDVSQSDCKCNDGMCY